MKTFVLTFCLELLYNVKRLSILIIFLLATAFHVYQTCVASRSKTKKYMSMQPVLLVLVVLLTTSSSKLVVLNRTIQFCILYKH